MQRNISGFLLIATGVLHCAVGLVLGWALLGEIVADGLIGAIADDPSRNAIFWFMFGGVMMIMLGALMHEVETEREALPHWLGWSLIALGLGGGLCIPASGFWLVIPQGLWLMRRRVLVPA